MATSLIVNSNDDVRWAQFSRWLDEVDAEGVEIIRISDAKSMCEGYARGTKLAHGDVLLYCHDDLEILSREFFAKVARGLERYDVVGIAGSAKLSTECAWINGGRDNNAGSVAHCPPNGGYVVCAYGRSASVVEALDGVFMGATRAAVEKLGWDAETFDGWHFYDIDFSWRAHLAGLRVGVLDGLACVHHSNQAFDSEGEWGRYRKLFREKHEENLPTGPSVALPTIAAVHIETADEVRDVMEGLGPRAFLLRGRRIDIGCGMNPADGHEGMDVSPLPTVEYVHNAVNFPWPFDEGSVAGINCSHYVEHIYEAFWHPEPIGPGYGGHEWTKHLSPYQVDDRSVCLFMKYFDEVYRVLAPGASARIQVPHGRSSRAFWDPTHRRFLQEKTFTGYLNKAWRKSVGLEHGAYGVSCDFDIKIDHLIHDWNYVRTLGPESEEEFQPWISARMEMFWNVADDMVITLTKRVPVTVAVPEAQEVVAQAT